MKLSEIREMTQITSDPISSINRSYLSEHAEILGLDLTKFHQELEMDSPYVDTYRDITYSNASVQVHSHTFYELLYCQNSCGAEYLVGTERYKLEQGDLIFVSPGVSHRPLLPERLPEPYIRDVIWISRDFMEGLCVGFTDDLDAPHATFLRTAGTKWEYLGELFRNGVMEAETKAVNWETAVFGNTLTLLAHLRRAYDDVAARPLRAEKPELLDQLLSYVELHLAEKITLSDIARHFYISESTITQTFRKKIGVSFYRWVTQRRLIAAKSLIMKGLPMESVSEQVGFADYSSFFRAFKQEYGFSPRQYRKQQNNSSDVR